MRHLGTETSIASIASIRSDSKIKALMRDELLINVQKFASQVKLQHTVQFYVVFCFHFLFVLFVYCSFDLGATDCSSD